MTYLSGPHIYINLVQNYSLEEAQALLNAGTEITVCLGKQNSLYFLLSVPEVFKRKKF
jgi:hypothetical protein